MMRAASPLLPLLVGLSTGELAHSASQKRTVLVTGATGRTGSLLYQILESEGSWNLRALVRNVTKAREMLGCSSCDESEGIFVGDVTDAGSLPAAMEGADALAITTGSASYCSEAPAGGADPKAIDFEGTKAQVEAFALAGGTSGKKQVLYVSTMGFTTDKTDRMFYHLQAEDFIVGSGINFAIAKACPLGDGAPGKTKLVAGPDAVQNGRWTRIQRSDVARVLVEALRDPVLAAGLRFDLCSNPFGRVTTGVYKDVLTTARSVVHQNSGLRGVRAVSFSQAFPSVCSESPGVHE